MKVNYTGQHKIPNRNIEVYVFDTNLKVVPHNDKEEGIIPGLFTLLRNNQENTIWPYTITNACVRYKRKGTGVDGIPKQMVKKLVPLDAVEIAYKKSRVNLWMFEIIGPNNAKLVLRIWNSNGNLEIASFDDEEGRVEDFINEALRLPGEYYEDEEVEYEPYPDNINNNTVLYPDASDDDANGHSPYMQNDMMPFEEPIPSNEQGIVPTNPYVQQAYENVNENDAIIEDEKIIGGGTLAICIISLLVFLAQAGMSFTVLEGKKVLFTSVFGAFALISLIGILVTTIKRIKLKRGKQTSMTLPKVIAGILLGILILEVITMAIIGVMLYTQTLPKPLHFLYNFV